MPEVKIFEFKDDGGDVVKFADIGDGFVQPTFEQEAAQLQVVVDSVAGYEVRTDDIFLATFAKTGTSCFKV